MSDPTTFLHLTDLHLSHPDLDDPYLVSDTAKTLDMVLQEIAGMASPPAFVIVSGDLSNRGEEKSYRLLAEKMAPLEMPVFYALGNHDNRERFRSVVLGESENLAAPYFYDRVVAGVHVIVLDTLAPGKVGGTLDDAQFAFLAEALGRETGVPKIVVMHHPPAMDEAEPMSWESIDVESTERLADILAGHKIEAILSGHVHVNRVSHWHGVPILIGSGQHNIMDVLYADGLRMREGAGFNLCTLRPSGLTAIMIPLPLSGKILRTVPFSELKALD